MVHYTNNRYKEPNTVSFFCETTSSSELKLILSSDMFMIFNRDKLTEKNFGKTFSGMVVYEYIKTLKNWRSYLINFTDEEVKELDKMLELKKEFLAPKQTQAKQIEIFEATE